MQLDLFLVGFLLGLSVKALHDRAKAPRTLNPDVRSLLK